MELARMATIENIEKTWMLIVSVTVAILTGYIISTLCHWFMKLDERISRSFPCLLAFSSLGTLPLVLGKALCFPGGMLEGDPKCDDIVGYMVINKLVFQILLFILGFILMPRDANFTSILTEKMQYSWHLMRPGVMDKDYSVFYCFNTFFKDKKKSEKMFDMFSKRFNLVVSEEERLEYKFIENKEAQWDFDFGAIDVETNFGGDKNNKNDKNDKSLEQNDYFKDNSINNNKNEKKLDNDIDRKKSVKPVGMVKGEKFQIANENNISNSGGNSGSNNNINNGNSAKDDIQNLNAKYNSKNGHNGNHNKNGDYNSNSDFNASSYNQDDEKNDIIQIRNLDHKLKFDALHIDESEGIGFNYLDVPYGDNDLPEDFSFLDISKDIENFEFPIQQEAKPLKRMTVEQVRIKTQEIIDKRKSSVKIFAHAVERYYKRMFAVTEANLDNNKKDQYKEYKLKVNNNIYSIPPKFPTATYVTITRDHVPKIEKNWLAIKKKAQKIIPNFDAKVQETPITFSLVLNKVYSPPIIGCFLGLILGMSGLRDIIFSDNHYIKNLYYSVKIIMKPTVPFLYVILGCSIYNVQSIDFLATPLKKGYLLFTFILRFLILPAIGYIYVWLWVTYYGGIIAESRVFRVSMFIPFCLPCTATILVVVNIVKYFREEAGIILFTQNITLVITLTILYTLYYVIVGNI